MTPLSQTGCQAQALDIPVASRRAQQPCGCSHTVEKETDIQGGCLPAVPLQLSHLLDLMEGV